MEVKSMFYIVCFTLIVLVLGATACKKNDPEPEEIHTPPTYYETMVYRTSFIDVFISLYGDKTKLIPYIDPTTRNLKMEIAYRGEGLFIGSPEHKELSEKYGDTSYNRKDLPGIYALEKVLKAIDVIALSDYDDEHPKGSSLNKIVSFEYITYLPYIQNNYTGSTGELQTCKLSEIPQSGIALIARNKSSLIFERKPYDWKHTEVEVTLRFEDDQTITKELSFFCQNKPRSGITHRPTSRNRHAKLERSIRS